MTLLGSSRFVLSGLCPKGVRMAPTCWAKGAFSKLLDRRTSLPGSSNLVGCLPVVVSLRWFFDCSLVVHDLQWCSFCFATVFFWSIVSLLVFVFFFGGSCLQNMIQVSMAHGKSSIP